MVVIHDVEVKRAQRQAKTTLCLQAQGSLVKLEKKLCQPIYLTITCISQKIKAYSLTWLHFFVPYNVGVLWPWDTLPQDKMCWERSTKWWCRDKVKIHRKPNSYLSLSQITVITNESAINGHSYTSMYPMFAGNWFGISLWLHPRQVSWSLFK